MVLRAMIMMNQFPLSWFSSDNHHITGNHSSLTTQLLYQLLPYQLFLKSPQYGLHTFFCCVILCIVFSPIMCVSCSVQYQLFSSLVLHFLCQINYFVPFQFAVYEKFVPALCSLFTIFTIWYATSIVRWCTTPGAPTKLLKSAALQFIITHFCQVCSYQIYGKIIL